MNPLFARLLRGLVPQLGADRGVERLAALLEVPSDELLAALAERRFCYRAFTIRKRHGGERSIAAPSSPLKTLQRRLLHRYLDSLAPHTAATAFRSGSSIATHARRHLGQALVLTVDLADFFPSTAARRVRRWFRNQGWKGTALEVLLRLCVYRGGLPQGAPTSPALSNLVNAQLDAELAELATLHQARYSRYSDDLAFSWGDDAEPLGFRVRVEAILSRYGYHVQAQKGWCAQTAAQRPEITGLVLANPYLRPTKRILERMRGLPGSRSARTAQEEQQYQGYRGLLQMLNPRRSPFSRK